jgi:glycosylphosphatidylinositol transamidase
VYRLNTYPLIHANFLHAFINCVSLAPLLERFEAEHGTLMTLAMFAGREYTGLWSRIQDRRSINTRAALSTLPAGLYLLCEGLIWRGNVPVMGAR